MNFGQNFTPIQLSCKDYHSCALSSVNTVKCWGQGNIGQLGLGDTYNRGDNDVNNGPMGDDLPEVNLGSDFTPVQVEVGYVHSCALSDEGKLKCWGMIRFTAHRFKM